MELKGGGLFWVISREEEAATASAPRVCVCCARYLGVDDASTLTRLHMACLEHFEDA